MIDSSTSDFEDDEQQDDDDDDDIENTHTSSSSSTTTNNRKPLQSLNTNITTTHANNKKDVKTGKKRKTVSNDKVMNAAFCLHQTENGLVDDDPVVHGSPFIAHFNRTAPTLDRPSQFFSFDLSMCAVLSLSCKA
jgi:hypothetical protein